MCNYMILRNVYFIYIMQVNPMEEEMCFVDSCTINTILREMKYFQTLTKRTGNILTIDGCDTCIVGSEKATIILPMGTQVTIENALLYPDSTCTLLSYRDFRKNGLHIATHEENNNESLLITKTNRDDYDFICMVCATRKLILRPSPLKIHIEPLKFLEMIHGDICGPIQPISGPFMYFMVLIDASTRWSHVCLLSTWSHAFAKIMAQVIRLKASFPKNRI
jgi:hypothetical protein